MSRVLSIPAQVFSSLHSFSKLVLFMVDTVAYRREEEEFFRCLASVGSTGSDMLLPNLAVLDLKMYAFFPGDFQTMDATLVTLIDSRWNNPSGSGLRRVILRYFKAGIESNYDDETAEDEGGRSTRNLIALSHIDRLKTLKLEGLDISIILEDVYERVEKEVFL
ncbi:uncharacterized protein EV420DRAFT_1577685 [Desarmillaria tabescens]|uniref:Uncharacterized protein n=1 Tax=Armillaria tabescens TaxID=1929756 RepID=A0AA39JIY3_ARMTA|nr:uncharacterized protein EV420DRAFT_1577685 [Desarmillaria tabescens]KAK0442785.1 hypothetical protein EV420DRAFT_1577685 [Desarmillaria tabescens]